jgi:murein DD-endopeptidase MepM/ murein hydrolase activator NlpD
MDRLARLRLSLERLFPERHLYVRSGGGEVHGYVLTTGKQAMAACFACVLALWLGVGSAAMVSNLFSLSDGEQAALRTRAYYERLIADRQARLNSAVAALGQGAGSLSDIARSVEERHRALALLLAPLKGQPRAGAALLPIRTPDGASPADRVRLVSLDQDRMLDEAETFAKSRADRLRLALRLAGLDPVPLAIHSQSLGGPLIDGKDPKALAAVLDVDEDFATRVQHAAASLDEMRGLDQAAQEVPLATPTSHAPRSSGFGVRLDPFTGRPAFHSGLDFAGSLWTPVFATAPGVISFTGVRNGYGNTVEIDHGRGFKTRYAHLEAISVQVGQEVAVGQRIGAIGSTGRSTGPHLHYEIWVNGRPQNPDRFLRAGDYVQQAE